MNDPSQAELVVRVIANLRETLIEVEQLPASMQLPGLRAVIRSASMAVGLGDPRGGVES